MAPVIGAQHTVSGAADRGPMYSADNTADRSARAGMQKTAAAARCPGSYGFVQFAKAKIMPAPMKFRHGRYDNNACR